jgi:hypothetical protein
MRGVELTMSACALCACVRVIRHCQGVHACTSSLSECVSALSACVCVRPVNSDLESGVIRSENLLLGCRDEASHEHAL